MGNMNFNTVAMAFLTVVFVTFSLSLLSEGIYETELEEFGYPIEVVGGSDAAGGEDAGPAFDPVSPLLASADPAAGETIFRKCNSCHTNDPSGANKTGPGLWGVVGRPVASHEGFGYSGALEEHALEEPDWSFEALNEFLWKPKTAVPGTSMGFAGLSDVQERANVIAYLNTLSENPLPYPDPAEAAAALEADAAPEGVEVVDGEVAPGVGESQEGAEADRDPSIATDVPPTDEVVQGDETQNVQAVDGAVTAPAAAPADASGTVDADGGLNQEQSPAVVEGAGTGDTLPEADAPAAEAPGQGVPGNGPGDAPVEGAVDATDGASTVPSVAGQGLNSNAIEQADENDTAGRGIGSIGGQGEDGPIDPVDATQTPVDTGETSLGSENPADPNKNGTGGAGGADAGGADAGAATNESGARVIIVPAE